MFKPSTSGYGTTCLKSVSRFVLSILLLLHCTLTAQARLNTGDFTCAEVKDLVFQQGAIVLNTRSPSIFDRFVADRSFCKSGENVRQTSAPSKSGDCRLMRCVVEDGSGDN